MFSWLVLPVLAAAEPSFHRDIQPILQKQCSGCHRTGGASGGLDVTTYAAFKAGGGRGAAFLAGDPDESLTVKYLLALMKPRMPMGGEALPKDQIELFREWIKAGAKDDSPAPGVVTSAVTKPALYAQAPVITALRYSPDGKTLAVAGNGEILLHRADGSGMVARLPGQAERLLSLAFSPDGKKLVAGGGTPARFGEVQVWDVPSASLLKAMKLTNDTVFGASLAPDGSRIAVGCADNTVHVYDATSGEEMYKITNHENWVLSTVFGTNSQRFVSVGRDRAAKLIDASTGRFLENVNMLRGELTAMARHPKKDVVVLGGEERIPYVYLMDRPKNMKIADDTTLVRKLARQNGPIMALDWSPDAKWIAVAGAAPEVNVYDAETGEARFALKGHTAGIYSVTFSPDSQRLATAGFDGQVRLYDTATGQLVKEFVPVPMAAGGGQ
jgi:Tol biopolymer transport system component